MYNEEDRDWLYKKMQDAGVDTGNYDEFKESLKDKNDRDWYYQKSQELGLDVGSQDEFDGYMLDGLDGDETDAAVTQQPTQPVSAESKQLYSQAVYDRYDNQDTRRKGLNDIELKSLDEIAAEMERENPGSSKPGMWENFKNKSGNILSGILGFFGNRDEKGSMGNMEAASMPTEEQMMQRGGSMGYMRPATVPADSPAGTMTDERRFYEDGQQRVDPSKPLVEQEFINDDRGFGEFTQQGIDRLRKGQQQTDPTLDDNGKVLPTPLYNQEAALRGDIQRIDTDVMRVFNEELASNQQKAADYMKDTPGNSFAPTGVNLMNVGREANKIADPSKAIETAIKYADEQTKGMPDQVRYQVIESLLGQMEDQLVRDRIPSGTAEYIFWRGFKDSDLGRIMSSVVDTNYEKYLDQVAASRYKAGFWENLGKGAVTLASDMWEYMLPAGAAGKAGKWAGGKISGRIMNDLIRRGVPKSQAARIAERITANSVGKGILQHGASNAVTFGTAGAISGAIEGMTEPATVPGFDGKHSIESEKLKNDLGLYDDLHDEVAETIKQAEAEQYSAKNLFGKIFERAAWGVGTGVATSFGAPLGEIIGHGRGVAGKILGDATRLGVNATAMTGVGALEQASTPGAQPLTFEDLLLAEANNLLTFGALEARGIYNRAKNYRNIQQFEKAYDITDADKAKMKDLGYGEMMDAVEQLTTGKTGGAQPAEKKPNIITRLVNGEKVSEVKSPPNEEQNNIEQIESQNLKKGLQQLVNDYNAGRISEEEARKWYGLVTGDYSQQLQPITGVSQRTDISPDGKVQHFVDYLDAQGRRVRTVEAKDENEAKQLSDDYRHEAQLNQISALEDMITDRDVSENIVQNIRKDFLEDQRFSLRPDINGIRTMPNGSLAVGGIKSKIEALNQLRARKKLHEMGEGKALTVEEERILEEGLSSYERDVANIFGREEALQAALQKQAEGGDLLPYEESLIQSAQNIYRNHAGHSKAASDFAREFEKRNGMDEGTLSQILEKKDRSEAEQKAVDDYVTDLQEYLRPRTEQIETGEENIVNGQGVHGVQDGLDRPDGLNGQSVQDGLNGLNGQNVNIGEAYAKGQEAVNANDAAAMRNIGYEMQKADARISKLFTDDEAKVIYDAVESGDAAAMAAVVQQHTEPAKRGAIEKLKEAHDAMRGVEDAINDSYIGNYEAIRAEIEPYQSEQGEIVPMKLSNGSSVYYVSGDLNNAYGTVMVAYTGEDGTVRHAQVPVKEITEAGTPIGIDDFVQLRAEDERNRSDERYKGIISGTELRKGNQVELTMDNSTGMFTVDGFFGNGDVQLRDENGGTIRMTKDEVLEMMQATEEKRINQDLADEQAAYKEAERVRQEEEKARLEAQRKFEEERRGKIAEIQKTVVDEAAAVPQPTEQSEEAAKWNGLAIADVADAEGVRKYLLDNYESEADADTFMNEQRRILKVHQRDEIQPEIDNISKQLNDYITGKTDLSDEELTGLVTQLSEWESEQNRMNGIAEALKDISDALPKTYAERKAEILKNASPYEQRKAELSKARTNKDKVRIAKQVYGNDPDVGTLFDDLDVPADATELVSMFLKPRVLRWEGVDQGGVHLRGVEDELGKHMKRGVGRNVDSNNINTFLAAKGEGKTVDEFVHDIWESPENHPIGAEEKRFDDTEIRNALIDLLLSAKNPTEIRDMIIDGRIAEAERILKDIQDREEEYEMQEWAKAYHLPAEERENYEDYVIRNTEDFLLSDEDYQKINTIFAEQNELRDEQNRRSQEMDRQPIVAGAGGEGSGGQAEVQRQGAKADVTEDQGRQVNGEGENLTDGTAVPGSDVSGGTQGELERAIDDLGRIEEEWYDKILDFVSQHYPTQAVVSAQTNSPKGKAERKAMLADPVYQDLLRQQKEALDAADKKVTEAYKKEEEKGKVVFKDRLSAAIEKTNTNPTDGQKEAGNYKKGHLQFGGYNFTVENPKGSVRSGKDASGKPWSITMHNTYGYLTGKGHLGKDGDHLDVFINDDADLDNWNGNVFVVDQVNSDGSFDEHKIMYGFDNEVDALRNYLMNYSRPWHGMGNITGVDKATFDKWVESSNRKQKPFAETRFGDNRDVVEKVMDGIEKKKEVADLREPDQSDAVTDVSKPQTSNQNGRKSINAETQGLSSAGKDINKSSNLQVKGGKIFETTQSWRPEELANMDGGHLETLINRRELQHNMNDLLLEKYKGKKREKLERNNAQIDADLSQLRGEQERRWNAEGATDVVGEPRPRRRNLKVVSHIEGNLFPEEKEGELFDDKKSAAIPQPTKKPESKLEKLSDEQLLEGIGQNANSKDWDLYIDEYDKRHRSEYLDAVSTYSDMLEKENVSLEDAYGMYADVAAKWNDKGFASDERSKLMAQVDALEEYVDRLESEAIEREESEEEEAAAIPQPTEQTEQKKEKFEEDKTKVRAHGYDLTKIRLRELGEGEASHVERRYVENGSFSFTGGEHIESAADVAYIFRQLEDAAVENSFMVLIKDGVPTVIHLAIGAYNGVMAPIEQAFAAYKEIDPDNVLFLHNHPSGNLRASREDLALQTKVEAMFGKKALPGIIIDTRSGKYAEFRGSGYSQVAERPKSVDKEIPVRVFNFSKQVFADDWNPETAFEAVSSQSMAAFVSSHRLGDHKKLSLIVMDQAGHVTGNVFLPWTATEEISKQANALQIATYVNQMGGRYAFIYGNTTVTDNNDIRILKTNLQGYNVTLRDVLTFEGSAYERGILYEPDVEYKGGVGRSLSDAEADALVEASMRRAEAMPLLELTPENWKAEFGSKGTVETPLGMVKLGENQYRKMEEKGRSKEFALIKPTLTNPDFIIEEVSEGKEGKTSRSSSYLYAKAFVGSNGKKQYFFKSVTVDQDGMEVNVSNYLDRAKRVKKSLMEGKLLWKRSELASDSSDVNQGLYNRPGNVSEPNTEGRVNPQSTLSIGKDREKSSNYQENGEKSLMGVHNISEEKLRKVLKQGGLANPSLAVIDTRNHIHTDYGEISLIPKSSLIDSRSGRNAGTWTADAWTPTYPEVTKRMSSKGQDRYWKETRKVLGDEPGDIRSKTMMAFESWMNRGIDPDRLSYWYLKERGRKPEQVMYEPSMVKEDIEAYHQAMGEHDRFSELDKAGRKAVLALIAKDRGETPDEMAAKMQELKERNLQRMNDENVKSFVKMRAERVIGEIDEYGVPYSYISDYDYKVRNAEKTDGKLDTDSTLRKAAEQVKAEGLEEDFGKWLEGKEKAYGIEEWLWNGTDNQGRNKFVRNTLENASRLMKKEGRNGAKGWSATGTMIAAVAKRVTTLDQIRKEKKNLNTTLEEHEAFKEKWGDALFDLCQKCYDGDSWVGEARLREALGEKDPVAYLKKEYGVELSKEDQDLLKKFIKEVRENFPTGYFETKFERPVGLDEFEIAVVPTTTSPEVVKALKNAGLEVHTYEPGELDDPNDENRRKAVMDAVKDRDDIMFSVRGGGLRQGSNIQETGQAARELATKAVMQVLDGTGVNYHVVSQEEAQAVLRKTQALRDGRSFHVDTPVFVSNALKAVEGIKQEKATPDQWLAMIQKNGGLKAGEDKWIGLSDWLKQQKGSITKQEVLDFIRDNQIQIEEVNYKEFFDVDDNPQMQKFRSEFDGLVEKYESEKNAVEQEANTFNDEMYQKYGGGWANDPERLSEEDRKRNDDMVERWNSMNDSDPHDLAFREMVDNYGDDFEMAFEVNYGNGKLEPQMDMYDEQISDAAKHFLQFEDEPIDSTRLDYTTEGLENKKEIAITVPTIDPYNESDNIHFGDAGGGRAVAWIRFGDTTIDAPATNLDKSLYTAKRSKNGGFDVFRPNGSEWGRIGTESAEQAIEEAYNDDMLRNTTTQRVLVIDEIQSKRHQDARDRGYKSEHQREIENLQAKIDAKEKEKKEYLEQLKQKYGTTQLLEKITNEEKQKFVEISFELDNLIREKNTVSTVDLIPEAPFEKNWHELAMKRMLRYAAENGYDKVAWTKGEQQAERYNIGNSVDKIISYDYPEVADPDGRKSKKIEIRLKGGDTMTMRVNDDGTVIEGRSDTQGKNLSDVVGKDLAIRILGGEGKDGTIFDINRDLPAKIIEGEGLRIGGEGMKGFYDQMLPRFMDKYGKKWGVRTGDVVLSKLGDNGITMHSVDVTPEMKESVMQGQPMFSVAGKEPMVTSEGVVYGYTDGKDIYLTREGINPETPAHEYGHLWVKAVKKNRPDLWENIKDLMKEDEVSQRIYQKLLGDDSYRQIHGDEDVLYEEVLTQMGGKKNRERFEQAAREVLDEAEGMAETMKIANVISKIRRAFRKLWEWIGKDLFGIKKFRSVDEVTDRMMYDFVEGTDLNAGVEAAVIQQHTGHGAVSFQAGAQAGKGKPRQKKGEGMASYFNRLREWERRKMAEEDESDPMPVMPDTEGIEDFEEMKRIQDEYRKLYEEWEVRHGLRELENAELGLYDVATGKKAAPQQPTEREQLVDQETDARVMQDLGDAVGYDTTPEGARKQVKYAVINRRKNLESASAEDAIFIHDLTKRLDGIAKDMSSKGGEKVTGKMLREALPDIIEGTYGYDIVKADNGEWIRMDHRAAMPIQMTPELQKVLDDIKDWYDEFYHVLEDAGLRGEAGYIAEGYVNHIWDKEKSDPKAWNEYVENYQRMKSPNMKKREIPTYAEGIAVGLVPKFTDITDIMSYYSRSNNEAVANRKFLDDLACINVDETNKDGEVVRSLSLITNVEPYSLDKESYTRPYDVPGVGNVWVHKSAHQRFASVFGTMRSADIPDWLHNVGKGYDLFGSTAKKIQLSFSGFHAGALTEVALAQMRPDKAMRALMKYIVYDSIKKGTLPAYAHPEDFKFAAQHLVNLGATADYAAADVNMITEKLRDFVKKLAEEEKGNGNTAAYLTKKGTGKVLTPVAALLDYMNKGMDKILWNYIHDGFKIACFKMFAEQIDKRVIKQGLSAIERERLLDEAGQYVNDTFGGQYWELLNVTPAQLKWMRRALLSPDWLVSTQRHFLANFGFGSLYAEEGFLEYLRFNRDNLKRAFGADIPRNEYRRFRSKNAKQCYLLGVCGFFYIMMNGINAIFRKGDEEEERERAEEIRKTDPNYRSSYELAYPDGMKWYDYTMYGNTIGQQTHLFLGRYKDGTEWYARWGKQFREFPELFMGRHGVEFPAPMIERMMGKANPVISYIRDGLGTLDVHGFEIPYQEKETVEKYGKTIAFLSMTAKHFLPFSVPTQSDKEFKMWDLVMPSQKGFSRWKAVDYFKTYINAGDMHGIEQTYHAAVMNNLDAEECLQAAIASVKATQKKELADGVTDLPSAFDAFDNATTLKQRQLMRKKIIQYMTGEDYREFTLDDAREKALSFWDGEKAESITKDNDKYIMQATSEDIRDDYKMDALYKKSIAKIKQLHEIEDAGKDTRRWESAFGEWIDVHDMLLDYRRDIKTMKKDLDGSNDKQVMNEIRKLRRDVMKRIDNIEKAE